jgi:sec-independent protein translocase protein TatA
MLPLAFGFGGPWDVAIVAGVILVLFGGGKLAGLGKSLGEGIKEFKKATHDEEDAAPDTKDDSAESRREPAETKK